MIEGTTRVDAYSINNEEVKPYIQKRERFYKQVKDLLEAKEYEVARDFLGSEDGEAIIYRESVATNWHLLKHLDPSIDQVKNLEEAVGNWLDENQ